MPNIDGKSGKFEVFKDFFPTNVMIDNRLTEYVKINCFHYLMKCDGLQIFENLSRPTQENLRESLADFCRKNFKPQEVARAKQNFQKLIFNP